MKMKNNLQEVKGMKHIGLTKRIMAGVLSGVVILGASACAILPEEEEELVLPIVSENAKEYKTYTVRVEDITSAVNAFGSVISSDNADARFSASGEIASLNVELGQSVQAGQLLGSIKNSELDKKIKEKENEVTSLTELYEMNPTTANEERLNTVERELSNLKKQQQSYNLYAPMTGKVTFLADKKKGDMVTPRDMILTVSGSKSFILEVATGLAEKVPVGAVATCEYEGRTYKGKVVYSSSDKNLNPASFGLNASFNGLGVILDSIPSNISAWDTMSVEIIIDSRENALVIPTSAVSTYDGKHYVYVWENGIRTEREVEIGIQSVTFYEVVSGLSEGEIITY